jgi:succinate dehydrogenase membrane anchor subunit
VSRSAAVRHWRAQRVSALILVPLSLWFVNAVLSHAGQSRGQVQDWLSQPLPALLMSALVLAVFYHLALGVRVVIEDYVADPYRQARAIRWTYLAALALAVISLAAVATIGLDL